MGFGQRHCADKVIIAYTVKITCLGIRVKAAGNVFFEKKFFESK
jgi:hypothetical protein